MFLLKNLPVMSIILTFNEDVFTQDRVVLYFLVAVVTKKNLIGLLLKPQL